MESISQKQCPKCKAESSETAYFCYNCGQSLKPRPESTSVSKQALIYFVSFFLAPFGLGYAFKYLNRTDRKSKTIGTVSLVLTVLAIITVIFTAKTFIEQEYGVINLINNGVL